MKKIIYTTLILSILFWIIGCSPVTNRYNITIDSIAKKNQKIAPSSYVIKALGKDTDENSLKFLQQSQYLAEILNQSGYTKVTHENLAEQIIYFDYGIENLSEDNRYSGESEVSVGVSWGFPFGYYHHHYHPFWYDMGYSRSYYRTRTLFNRYVVILSKEQTGAELWRVDVSSIGESDNLKKIIPLLIKASKLYIGTTTDEPIKLTVTQEIKESVKKE
jgi:hypothetical protein